MVTSTIPSVAIIGRTNVGKSSLFNALIGRRVAVVKDEPGVTRDRNYALVTKYKYPFTLIDCGGIVGEVEKDLAAAVTQQAELAIAESSVIIAIFDGLEGVHPFDAQVVELLRMSSKPVIWVVNKAESQQAQISAAEFYELGITEPIAISAAHRIGLDDLIEAINKYLTPSDVPAAVQNRIRLAVVGRPNVGKSSLVNKLVGTDRLVTSAIPGTTRDAINVTFTRNGHNYEIVDTAGLRKRDKVEDLTSERFGNLRTIRALIGCDVALLLIDATEGVSEQDKNIAALIDERGRGLVIVVNKWDAVEKDHNSVKGYEEYLREMLPFCRYAPIVFVSALTGKRCHAVLDMAAEVFANLQKRIKTSELNEILSRAFERRSPPIYRGSPIKLHFAVQSEDTPPSFILFVTSPRKLNSAYQRYLKNTIRDHEPFTGCAIKLLLKKKDPNPT